MPACISSPNPSSGRATLRGALARDWRAMTAASAFTVAIQLSVFFLARPAAGERGAVLACLAAGAVWVALAGACLAAGGDNWLSMLLRGGIVADASAVSLLVVWLVSDCVGLRAAAEIYVIYAGSALLGVAAAAGGRTGFGRSAAAICAAVVMMLALAGPFWIGGILKAADHDTAKQIAAAAVRVNPFYSITAAVYEKTGFAWNEAKVMYDRVRQIQDYASASPRWYSAPAIHAAAAALLAAISLARRPRRPSRRRQA